MLLICFDSSFPAALNNRFRHRFQNTAMSPTFRRSQVTEYRDCYRSHRELSRQSTSPSGQIANARPFLATNQNLVRDIPIPSATLSAPITRCCPQRTKTETVEPHSLSLSFETAFLFRLRNVLIFAFPQCFCSPSIYLFRCDQLTFTILYFCFYISTGIQPLFQPRQTLTEHETSMEISPSPYRSTENPTQRIVYP